MPGDMTTDEKLDKIQQDVAEIKESQARKVALHEARAKGFITALTLVTSTLGAALALIGKYLWSMLGAKP